MAKLTEQEAILAVTGVTEAKGEVMVEVQVMKIGDEFQARIVKPGKNVFSGFGVKEVVSGKSGWEALSKMADNWKRAGFQD